LRRDDGPEVLRLRREVRAQRGAVAPRLRVARARRVQEYPVGAPDRGERGAGVAWAAKEGFKFAST